MPPYDNSAAPHIHARESVAGIHWKTVLGLLPVWIWTLSAWHLDALRLVAACSLSAMLTEIFARAVFRRRRALYDGSAVLTALTFTLLLPPSTPNVYAALGGAAAVLLGREIFGGLGANPFHAPAVGVLLLEILQEHIERSPRVLVEGCGWPFAVSALFLMLLRIGDWRMPFVYLSVFFFSTVAAGRAPVFDFLTGSILLAAFFMVQDSAGLPLAKAGRYLFAAGAGALTVVFQTHGISASVAACLAVLVLNALSPWLEKRRPVIFKETAL